MTTKAEEKTKAEETVSLGNEIVTDLEALQKLIKEAIDRGAKNVEEVHQAIAKLPLSYLEKITKAKKLSKNAIDFQEKTIGNTYKLIRTVNEKASEIAVKLLDKTKKYVK